MKINSLRYLGHSAVLLESINYVIAIDPWLEGNPSCPEEYKNPSQLDLIILTHGHSDHAGDALRLCKHFGSELVATYELATILISEGVSASKVHPMNKGGTIQLGELSISLTHAMHSSSYDSKNGTLYAGEACGVVIKTASICIYHAGDTALFSDMALIREKHKPQIALLPIGDRFTMGPEEAAIAASIIQATKVIPIHHSTFDLLTGKPEQFETLCRANGINSVILAPGESLEI